MRSRRLFHREFVDSLLNKGCSASSLLAGLTWYRNLVMTEQPKVPGKGVRPRLIRLTNGTLIDRHLNDQPAHRIAKCCTTNARPKQRPSESATVQCISIFY